MSDLRKMALPSVFFSLSSERNSKQKNPVIYTKTQTSSASFKGLLNHLPRCEPCLNIWQTDYVNSIAKVFFKKKQNIDSGTKKITKLEMSNRINTADL